jgi:tRNA nucleotidyltransferase (CCA-adding enzyme)
MNQLLTHLQGLFPGCWHNRIFLVGGSVRDFLQGKPGQDLDLVAALPDDVLKTAGFRLVTAKTTTPIWFQYLSSIGKIEIIQIDGPDLLHDDLMRRDFTINAIAMQLSGELIDPLDGKKDLEQGLLRVCSGNSFKDLRLMACN